MPTVLLLVFVMGLFFVLKPAINRLSDNSDNVQKKLIELEIEKGKVSELPRIKDKFMKVDMSKDKLNVLFAEENIVDLVKDMEKLAEKTGNTISISVEEESDSVKIKNMTVKKDSEEEADKLLDDFLEEEYFKIDVDIMGDYLGLIKFIDGLNSLDYYNSLVGFEIASQEEEKKSDGDIRKSEANKSDQVERNLILSSKLSIVFYLNKIANK